MRGGITLLGIACLPAAAVVGGEYATALYWLTAEHLAPLVRLLT